jgi:eukaryotic-like serine/threonine-protein kinase
MRSPIGRTLSHYKVLSEISQGGMGTVYRALDVNLGREIALKLLPPELVADPKRRRRFEIEARAAATLEHPHVAAIYEIDEAEGSTFIAMELIRGQPLSEVLRRGRMEPVRVLELAVEVAEGLARAHDRGIVHRDLKPGNIMLTEDDHAKIIDFGLAKLNEPAASGDDDTQTGAEGATEAGTVLGTAAYMSPEQARGLRVDHRSDIFSFGIVLHEMLSGERPFRGDSRVDMLHAILHSPAPRLLAPSGAPDVQRILDRCLAKDPQDRYPTMKDAIVDLRAAWRRLESGSWPDASPTEEVSRLHPTDAPTLERLARPGQARPWLAAAALLLLAAAAAGGWRAWSSRGSARIEALAVLPLQNLSGDPEQEYFADGLTEALISDLAKIRALKVISRTSAMRYKGTKESLPDIARALGVDAVVEGSVLRSGERVRITAQLIDAASDRHLWSESYERDVRDVLALQREVARAIAREVQVALTPEEQAGLGKTRPVDAEAYQLHLKGRYMWNKRSREGFDKALQLFQEAIDKDPAYAPAYSGLADTYGVLASVGYDVLPEHEAMPKARAAALRALDIDPNLAEAHASLAWVKHRYDWDWPAAEREFKLATSLNPGYATAHQWHSELLSTLGRHDEGLEVARRARDLDPLSLIINHNVARRLYFARRFDEAVAESKKTLEMDPQFRVARVMLGLEHAALGRFKEAAGEFEASGAGSLAGYAYGRSGRTAEALEVLSRLRTDAQSGHVPPTYFMFVHLGLGQKEEALAWLEKGFAARSDYMIYLGVDPILDPLRGEPRFQDLLRRVGLPAPG